MVRDVRSFRTVASSDMPLDNVVKRGSSRKISFVTDKPLQEVWNSSTNIEDEFNYNMLYDYYPDYNFIQLSDSITNISLPSGNQKRDGIAYININMGAPGKVPNVDKFLFREYDKG